MENTIIFPMILDLQLFAEGAGGGDGGTGSEGTTGVNATAAVSQPKGVKSNPLANVVYGKQAEEPAAPVAEVEETPTEDRNAKYEAFLKEYKDLDDARVQSIVQKRLRGDKETVEKYNALSPIIELLAKKHGVDATNIEALQKAIEEDDSYFEEEALAKGMTVQQLKEVRRIEKENAELRKFKNDQTRRENAEKLVSNWIKQANQAKTVYPSLDLRAEMQNPQFAALLRSNIDVKTAYEVIHKDDILHGAMQFTAKTVEQKLANKIAANGARPTENGNSSQGASVTKSDVSQLTKSDRAEIARRVAQGDRISFG